MHPATTRRLLLPTVLLTGLALTACGEVGNGLKSLADAELPALDSETTLAEAADQAREAVGKVSAYVESHTATAEQSATLEAQASVIREALTPEPETLQSIMDRGDALAQEAGERLQELHVPDDLLPPAGAFAQP